jgi:hypothetical protein
MKEQLERFYDRIKSKEDESLILIFSLHASERESYFIYSQPANLTLKDKFITDISENIGRYPESFICFIGSEEWDQLENKDSIVSQFNEPLKEDLRKYIQKYDTTIY